MLRARGESGELYPELSTVAAAGGSGRVARRGERQREGNGRWRLGSDAWKPAQAGGGREGGPARRAVLPSGGEEQSRQTGWRKGKRDRFAISKNSRDHSGK